MNIALKETQQILDEILSIKENNLFLTYIINRLLDDNYRGWHISQHNRYNLNDIGLILQNIYDVVGTDYFTIPPGDYAKDDELPEYARHYQAIVDRINSGLGRGTINSIKKNFFPDLEKMGFLAREKIKINETGKTIFHGRLTIRAVEFIEADILIDRYKKFTDAIDRLFGSRISELATMLHLSDYMNDKISIYEFMFIFSDDNEGIDKIKLLDSYRSLRKYEQRKVIKLVKAYANPQNFEGNKTAKRDIHNWKNQAQQIMGLLKTTVYFEVDNNRFFRLNVGNTGFFHRSTRRSAIPKRKYFSFHEVEKKRQV